MARLRVILVLCLVPAAIAQSDWATVQAMPQGAGVRLLLTSGESVRGRLNSVSDAQLVLIEAKGPRSLTRSEISKVALKNKGHRGRNALIGLGIGAGAGLALGAGVDANNQCPSFCILGRNPGKEIFTPLGAIVGVVVGAVLPTGGWRNIYVAP